MRVRMQNATERVHICSLPCRFDLFRYDPLNNARQRNEFLGRDAIPRAGQDEKSHCGTRAESQRVNFTIDFKY